MHIKQIFLVLYLIFSSSVSYGSTVLDKPVVDERVELLSIIFRLAECEEYSSQKNSLYVKRIDAHFQPYKNHALIRFVQKVRQYGVGYDAVMQMAIHVGSAPNFEPLRPFSKSVPETRWGKSRAKKFRNLLKVFYEDAQCETFFQEQRAYYAQVVEQFMPIYDSLDINWYTQFYGAQPKERFKIILAPGNGGNNYGPLLDLGNNTKEIYAIMGVWEFGDDLLPRFTFDDFFPILLHEFNHSFVNPLFNTLKGEFESSCSLLFKQMEVEMRNQAYGDWEVMLNESVVRAAVVIYMQQHHFSEDVIQEELNENYYRGFIWIHELVAALKRYADDRGTYPQLVNFRQELERTMSAYAANIDTHVTAYNSNRPKIVSITEFSNGAQDVNPTLTTITIHFDQEMLGYGYSINYGDKGKKYYPEIKKVNYAEDKRSVILTVELKQNQEYELVLLGKGFRSKSKVPILPYLITFKTL